MKRWLSVLCLLIFGASLLGADEKAVKTQVISLSIYKSPPPKPGTFMANANGVHMELMLSLPKQFITGVDAKASKLDRFSDDKDNVLFKKTGGLFGSGANWLAEYGMRFDAEGGAVVHIQGNNPPGKGAEKIILKGSVTIKCGSEEKATDTKEMTHKPKEEADVGPFKVRVSQFGNTIEVLSSEENVKKIELFDDKGKPIFTGPPSHGRNLQAKDKMPFLYSVFLPGKRDAKFSVKIHYFPKVETVDVPLDLRIGLSLE